MMKLSLRMQVLSALMLVCICAHAQIPAFPGAKGFGAYATGGRGGDVYTVTSLNNNGAGTLREALNTVPPEGRTIVFAVSGYIPVVSDTNFQVPSKVTIAGQTAPGDGVGLQGGRMLINGNNVVMRHFRIRHGKYGTGGDCLNIAATAHTTMLDHISMMFSTDENFSFFNSGIDDFTMQYSTSSWGMERHNAGGLWDLEDGTCHHSLWAHHRTRNPKARPNGVLEWINNVTFHWRNEPFIMGDSQTPADWKANVQGCYYISIDDADDGSTVRNTGLVKATVSSAGIPNFSLYLDDTLFDNNTNGIVDGTDLGYGIVAGAEFTPGDAVGANRYYKSATPFPGATGAAEVVIDDPLTAYKKVVSSAGPLRLDANHAGPLRDELDELLMDSVVNQYSILVQSDGKVAGEDPNRTNNGEQLLADQFGISNNGFGTLNSTAYPSDSDGDGMPDFWEITTGSDHTTANHNDPAPVDGYIPSPSGYTMLEEYLHFKAIPHAVIEKNTVSNPTSLTVDLRRYTDGFADGPSFTVINTSNGSIQQFEVDGTTPSSTGPIVEFTPTQEFSGRAFYIFKVSDSAGSIWIQKMAVFVDGVEPPEDLTWQGDGSANVWDYAAANFLSGGASTVFNTGDNVLFDDTGSRSPAIQVTGNIAPAFVEVDTALGYTFGGSGVLAGGMSLEKKGSGSLTIQNTGPNTYTGGTIIRDGAVYMNVANGLGNGPLTMQNDAALFLGTRSLVSGNALTVSGSPTITGGNGGGLTDIYNVSGSGVLNINATSVFDLQGDMSGFNGSVVFSGNSTARFYGSSGGQSIHFDLGDESMYLGKRSNIGTVYLGALSGGPNTTIQGSTGGGNTTATILDIGRKGINSMFAGSIIDGGGVTSIGKYGNGTLTLSGNKTYTGSTTVNDGTLAGSGSFGSYLTVAQDAALSPGNAPGEVGTMTIANGIDLSPATLYFDLSSNPAAGNDQIVNGAGTLTWRSPGGNLGARFEFNLIDGYLSEGTYYLITGGDGSSAPGSPAFTHNLVNTPTQTYQLQRSGGGSSDAFVRLVVTDLVPPSMDSSYSNGIFTITWPSVKTGWILQRSTNLLNSADWVNIPNSATTNSRTIPLDIVPWNDAYFRLIEP